MAKQLEAPTRRAVLAAAGFGVAAVAVGARSARDQRIETVRAFARAGDGAAPWWLLHPLAHGAALGRGWVLGALSPVVRGASVVELRKGDEVVRVHVCARRGAPCGLCATALFDLVLMDGGQGSKPTDEALGTVVLGLARRIRRNELRASADLGDVRRLLTHDERVALFGPEALT